MKCSTTAWLRGTDGSVTMQRDALNRTRASAEYPRIDPKDGLDLELTIDAEYQQVAEDELTRGVQRMKAESGLVVMVDPATGELLAVAHVPSVDPNNTATLDQATLRNRTITDTFEPGSIFKVVTATAALEKGVVRLDETFNGETREVHCSHRGRTHQAGHRQSSPWYRHVPLCRGAVQQHRDGQDLITDRRADDVRDRA